MMFRFLALLSVVASVASAASPPGFSSTKVLSSSDIPVNSNFGRTLMQNARSLNENNGVDYSFISDYSIKFQGCHSVSQWNADADDENDVRIKTKRLVRFRLCLSGSCQSEKTAGCTTKFGDYVVDLNTFVAAYLYNSYTQKEELCATAQEDCQETCGGDDDDCMTGCYDDTGMSMCYEEAALDVNDYAECAQYDMAAANRRKLEEDVQYYLGPFCADQGGEIHLGLFTDDTCTTFAQNGEALFYTNMGYELPYSDTSMISTQCVDCAHTADDGSTEVSDLCTNVYQVSGKCETKMNVDYPNESACTYIEGIKIIRADGVIRTSSIKKSKSAAVCIGLFLTVAVLLAGYVYYLRTKLGRAKVNLAAASEAVLT